MACEDCIYANWDYSVVLERTKERFGRVLILIPQFDYYCYKNKEFYLSNCQPDCKGKTGKNNCYEITSQYYQLEKDVRQMAEKFMDFMEKNNLEPTDYNKELEQFIKEHNRKLYKRLIDKRL